jgi:hypothetical protein
MVGVPYVAVNGADWAGVAQDCWVGMAPEVRLEMRLECLLLGVATSASAEGEADNEKGGSST